MAHEQIWKVLSDLLLDLKKRGESIPPHVVNDLRSAKTLMNILRADPTCVENIPRIETYLDNVESYLIFVAQKKFGAEYVEQWMRKLGKAGTKPYERREEAPRFVPGLPRGERWIRVQISEDVPKEFVEKLAKESGLSHKVQKNGYILVCGDDEKIKVFVKKVAGVLRNSRKG